MPANNSVNDVDHVNDLTGPVKAGDLLWRPSAERIANANMTAFMAWLKQTRGLDFAGYPELWEWSVTDLDAFWQAIWDYNDITVAQPPRQVLGKRTMPGAEWFPGARLNYAQNVLARERPGEVALYYHSETTPVTPLPLNVQPATPAPTGQAPAAPQSPTPAAPPPAGGPGGKN